MASYQYYIFNYLASNNTRLDLRISQDFDLLSGGFLNTAFAAPFLTVNFSNVLTQEQQDLLELLVQVNMNNVLLEEPVDFLDSGRRRNTLTNGGTHGSTFDVFSYYTKGSTIFDESTNQKYICWDNQENNADWRLVNTQRSITICALTTGATPVSALGGILRECSVPAALVDVGDIIRMTGFTTISTNAGYAIGTFVNNQQVANMSGTNGNEPFFITSDIVITGNNSQLGYTYHSNSGGGGLGDGSGTQNITVDFNVSWRITNTGGTFTNRTFVVELHKQKNGIF